MYFTKNCCFRSFPPERNHTSASTAPLRIASMLFRRWHFLPVIPEDGFETSHEKAFFDR